MVHALREAVRILKPTGLVLDLRPIASNVPIEIVTESRTYRVHEIDGSPGAQDDAACEKALKRLLDEGTLIEVNRKNFEFHHYWDTVGEMHKEILTTWPRRNVIPNEEDLTHVHKAFNAEGTGAVIRLTRPVLLVSFRVAHGNFHDTNAERPAPVF